MQIYSPKSDFLGGALVSASHLGKLIEGTGMSMYLGKPSKFLDVNQVKYNVVSDLDELIKYPDFNGNIWVNDICCDEGYYQAISESNWTLWNRLTNFRKIWMVNHQPISRVRNYLQFHLTRLRSSGFDLRNFTLFNYRAWWNIEWDNLLKAQFPEITVCTLPYHYYLGYVPDVNFDIKNHLNQFIMIGRSNSKCKIHHYVNQLKDNLPLQIFPDPNLSNHEFLKILGKYPYILTGYFYGCEGDPERDVVYNHLEWSYMDSILVGAIPVTSSLFSKELARLRLDTPIVDYRNPDLNKLDAELRVNNKLQYIPLLASYCRSRLIDELEFGNSVLMDILQSN